MSAIAASSGAARADVKIDQEEDKIGVQITGTITSKDAEAISKRMLAQALIVEADAFVVMWKEVKLPDGRDRIVRHGHGPHRAI